MNTFALEQNKQNYVEVIEHGGEIWINQKHLEKKSLISQTLLTELNILLQNLKK